MEGSDGPQIRDAEKNRLTPDGARSPDSPNRISALDVRLYSAGDGCMTVDELLAQLDSVKQRGSRWSARCPSHADRSPSLSVAVGERGILLRCWAGCSLQEICGALGIAPADLFYDGLSDDPQQRRQHAAERDWRRAAQAEEARRSGRVIDALKAADLFIRSRCGLDISTWTDAKLDEELSLLGEAYALLEREAYETHDR